ncbi:hypothetical protein BST30_01805 [Mycobacterium mantenii]|uniref:Uncharacterized protein n=1 Tax=Mycobacterium mantenii TaxID=560555 RepID=A0A1X0G5D1_MYCNT|nr:hypothetical protein BST30_01805 [Mycobacterium mantenii]
MERILAVDHDDVRAGPTNCRKWLSGAACPSARRRPGSDRGDPLRLAPPRSRSPRWPDRGDPLRPAPPRSRSPRWPDVSV